jgi:hypothetical protein
MGAIADYGALIEADIGMHRCGTDTTEETVALARALEASRVDYRGLMGYEGHAVLIAEAEKIAGLELTDEEREAMRQGLDRNAASYQQIRDLKIPNEVPPSLLFEPAMPGVEVDLDRDEIFDTTFSLCLFDGRPRDLTLIMLSIRCQ